MNTGKCPHCNTQLFKILVEYIDLIDHENQKFKGTNFVCMDCHKIITSSVGVRIEQLEPAR